MSAENKKLVEALWRDLYSRDFDKVASYFDADSHYEDVPAPDGGADGASNIVKRLKIGLEPIDGQHWRAYFGPVYLGVFDAHRRGL